MIMDDRGRTLVVRKRGTDAFMQAGGKLEEGESSLNALRREIVEELGCHVVQGSECFLGCLQAEAANEPGATVEAQIYSIALASPPKAQA